MNPIEIFFAPAAHDVMVLYRRKQYRRRAVRSLDEHLQRLRDECSLWQKRDKAEIGKRESDLADAEAQLNEANEAVARLSQKRNRLAESIDAWWKRLGIWLMRIASKESPSVKDIRAQIAFASGKLPDAEQRVEDLLELRRSRADSVRELAEPIASHEYAIIFLEDQREELTREIAEVNTAIFQAVRSTVRSLTPHTLMARVHLLAKKPEVSNFAREVLQLHDVLAELEAWPTDEEAIELVLQTRDTLDRVQSSVQAGFQTVDGNGQGTIAVKGQGTSHVQKTRTRMETTRDANGHTHTRPRSETYWDKVNVTFSGGFRVSFPIHYDRWSADALAEAIQDESDAWFKAGRSRQLQGEAAKTVRQLEQQADALVRKIRQRIEAYAAASG